MNKCKHEVLIDYELTTKSKWVYKICKDNAICAIDVFLFVPQIKICKCMIIPKILGGLRHSQGHHALAHGTSGWKHLTV